MTVKQCSVDNCEEAHRARGLCSFHYGRAYRFGQIDQHKLTRSDYNGVECYAEECERRARTRGLCELHWTRLKNHGDVNKVLVQGVDFNIRRGKGDQSPRWQGDNVSYSGAHARVRSQRGRASDYDCEYCGEPAKGWSYDGTDENVLYGNPSNHTSWMFYSLDTSKYRPLCNKCHRKEDRVAAQVELEEYRRIKIKTQLTYSEILQKLGLTID